MSKGEIVLLVFGVFCVYLMWILTQLFFYAKEPATFHLLFRAVCMPWKNIEMEDIDKVNRQSRSHFEKRRNVRMNGNRPG